MKSGLTVLADHSQDIIDALNSLVQKDVLVGIPSDKASRDDGAEINNAVLGYIQSYGGTIRIPEHVVTLNRKINSDGSFAKNGQFVQAKAANFSTDHTVPSYTVTLPPRPFLDIGIANARAQITEKMRQAAVAAFDGNEAAANRYLESAGVIASNAAKAVIQSGNQLKSLAESTKAARRARGHYGEKPLYETGSLLRSITYVVRDKNASS
jgi:hypothetical protein